jgi:Protein of unknown function (DUF1091)
MSLPKFNYCDLYGGLVQFDVIKSLFLQLQKYGNVTSPCPIEAGHYYLKNLQIDDRDFGVLMGAFPVGNYASTVDLTDEYGPKVVKFASIEIFGAITKSWR